jgi:polyphosphate glucokinase
LDVPVVDELVLQEDMVVVHPLPGAQALRLESAQETLLGIDFGGSGIKGAPVNIATGELLEARYRVATPRPSTPDAVAEIFADIRRHFDWQGPIGCAMPSVVKNGVSWTAANIDKAWIGTDARQLFRDATACPVTLLNDADAAGIAEMTFGAGAGRMGTVILLTFGTGIGSALYLNGKLWPNSELGHIEFEGDEAEHQSAARVKEDEDLSWKEWGGRVHRLLRYLETLFWPDLFIIGGGISRDHRKFFHLFTDIRAEIVPAELRNNAGIVGAALAAHETIANG